jgi:carbonic anhydrase
VPTAAEVLSELQSGNARFTRGESRHPRQDAGRRAELTGSQAPLALVLSCSDSRVPGEIVFDQGLGDLFVVRTAGQVLDDAVLGSVEFGVAVLGVPLVVVLGHEGCGAVRATLDVLAGAPFPKGHIARLVEMVTPSALAARENGETSLDQVVAEHARRTGSSLVERAPALAARVANGSCSVASMQYHLGEGAVELLDVIGALASAA